MNRTSSNRKGLGLSLLALVLLCLGLMATAQAGDASAVSALSLPPLRVLDAEEAGIAATEVVTAPTLHYRTVPEDFPHLLVTSTESVAPGYLFWSVRTDPPYLLMTDNTGDPVYYKRAIGNNGSDFRRLADGLLSYSAREDHEVVIIDSTYSHVRTPTPGAPFTELDGHDHVLLANGNILIEVVDIRTIDMSEFVPGGYPTATVEAQILQEIDADEDFVWEWNSWDVFTFTDAYIDLTAEAFDYVHINSMEEDADGGIIISSRRVDEVTKIARPSGDVVWRLGGKNNQFTMVGDGQWFSAQHDARRLPNGNLTIYDNRCSPRRPGPPCTDYSRGVEYELDEVNMEATQVWEFWNQGQAIATGSHRRLDNGNSLMGWGRSNFGATEVDADDNVVLDANFLGNPLVPELSDDSTTTYRVVRYEWEGCPAEPPTLVAEYGMAGEPVSLYYSWNGATSVTEYEVYGGTSPEPTTLLATQPRTGFEDVTTIGDLQEAIYYFRVLPVTSDDCVAQYSNEVIIAPKIFATHVRILPLPNHQMLLGVIRVARRSGGAPVPGATVDMDWTSPAGGGMVIPRTQVTGPNGLAVTLVRHLAPGTYTLDLTNVTLAGYVYDPLLNWEESASWTTP